ncbi:MAG: serine hydrolase [Cyclobacteriaceae bacterium]|nr:serine hydrolase [Cyclobacteriaceae bacterium]
MKHRFIFVFLVLHVGCLHAFSQPVIISGKLLNGKTKAPIPYANIGIMRSNAGTISNPDGTFSLRIPEKLKKDTLLVSALGFGKKPIPIQFLLVNQSPVILLHEQPTMLSDVSITAKREKNKIYQLGNRDVSGGVLETDTLYAGYATALLIESTAESKKQGLEFPVYVEKARLRILRNNLPSFKFRVRLNEVDSVSGHPGADMLRESVVMESTMRKGWLEFDLTSFKMLITKPFFATFEQILDKNDRTAIADGYREFIRAHPDRIKIDTIEFEGKKEPHMTIKRGGIDLPGTFIAVSSKEWAAKKYTCYTRQTSFAEWVKVRGIVTATVSVSNQPVTTKEKVTPCAKSDAVCNAQKVCENFMDETGVNGMQICVSRDGVVKWSGVFGYANVETQTPVTAQTKFRINSISKSLTSLALIRLMAERKFDPDAPVQKYVPEFPEKKYPVTARQLAGHVAGIRDYHENDLSDLIRTEHYASSIDALKIFSEDSLLFEPGTRFHYSSFGWNLLGALIEKISGKHYLTYMTETVFEPFGMQATIGDDATKEIPDRSTFYDLTGQPNDLGDISYKYAGGGLLSTAEDLVKFGNEILNGKSLTPKQREALFQSQKTKDGKDTGYGLGWYTGIDRNGHRIWYHAGDSFSSSSWLVIYPDDNLVVALVANSQHAAAFDIYEIGELFYRNN